MKRHLTAPALIALVALSAMPASAGWKEGWKAHDFGDFATAIREWLPLAEKGDAVVQFAVGRLYFRGGLGIERNYKEAARWFRKAAEQGYAAAQNNLGRLSASGRGVPQDYAEAVSWFRKAAEQGHEKAQHNLGEFYASGRVVEKNLSQQQHMVRALMWFTIAARQGDIFADIDREDLSKRMEPAQIAEAQRLAREWWEAFEKRKGGD